MVGMQSGTRVLRTVVVAGLTLVMGVSSFRTPQEPPYQLRECPQHWDSVSVVDDSVLLHHTAAFEGYSLTGPITDVPEFHDCQKLIMTTGRDYGPLAAIFAAYYLSSLELLLDSLESKVDISKHRPDTAGGVTTSNRTALAAGLILNLGAMYPALDIHPGFSCLYVWRTGAGTVWHASIDSVGDDHMKCIEPRDPKTLSAGELKVIRDEAPRFTRDRHYPAVARWEWDERTRQHFMGIECGRAWCQVGRRGFTPSDPWLPGAPTPSREAQIQRIKGWYDEQFLADSIAPGVWKPSSVRGTVFPDTSLGTRRRADYHNTWLPSAYVALSKPSAYYQKKFNFYAVPSGARFSDMNTVSFCWGTRRGCKVPMFASVLPSRRCPGESFQLGGLLGIQWPAWRVRIDAPGSSGSPGPKYGCVTRTDHSDVEKPLPPTARWRWLADDETIWKECIQGCCEVARTLQS